MLLLRLVRQMARRKLFSPLSCDLRRSIFEVHITSTAESRWKRFSVSGVCAPKVQLGQGSSANLKHLTDRLSDSWSIVSEVELSRFLDFYKERRIVEPFKDRESWLQASKFIDEVNREPMDTKLPHAAKGCEQSARKEKLMESAFQGALKMT
uniref:Uncharacterized protein n=1 Tax=Parascaris equorum TaxID=6256 RepID=A0A914RT37_PAREQ